MRRFTSSRCIPRRYVDVLGPVDPLPASGTSHARDAAPQRGTPTDSVVGVRTRATDPSPRAGRSRAPGGHPAPRRPVGWQRGGPVRIRYLLLNAYTAGGTIRTT